MDNNQFNEFKEYEVDLSGNSKIFSVLAYFGILFIVGLIIEPEKNNPFVKNHVNNSIIINIAYWVFGIVAVIPIIGWIITALGCTLCFVLQVIGIIYAIQGKFFNIPYCDQIKIVK